jgi:formylglycine-generating enzyme required for sulfatase activity
MAVKDYAKSVARRHLLANFRARAAGVRALKPTLQPKLQLDASRAVRYASASHIACNGALACAQWMGRRLSTEAQWELAARGRQDGEDYWSRAFDPEGKRQPVDQPY